MIASKCPKLHRSHLLRGCTRLYHFRRLDDFNKRRHNKDNVSQVSPRRPSLLEELFPEDFPSKETDSFGKVQDVPRLPLPEVDEFVEKLHNDFGRGRERRKQTADTAAAEAFKRNHLTVVSLQTASKSLVESDFRRIAPKGKHIGEWTGPGDILKVIPGRDLRTLEQAGHYFLLFPNPAHARAYQSHVVHLHRVAKMHTPTSVESPLPLQPGVLVEGEDVHSLLQDYALYPPSQRMSLKILDSPHTASIQSLLQENGYRQLVEGEAKTGRSVLLWVDGRRLTTNLIRNSVAADGRDRGLAWNFSIERVKNHQDTINTGEENEPSNDDGGAELKPWRHAPQRWILSFTDENEARRFVRMWHRKPFPTAEEDGLRLVHAEFLW